MEIDLYLIDAFASHIFEGNPAAVCPLSTWLADDLMQAIAMENNLSETAFFVSDGDQFHIRWFTPVKEVDLCGHATLATAFVLFEYLGDRRERLQFRSRSGLLTVERSEDGLTMDFPAQPPQHCPAPPGLLRALRQEPVECLRAEDYIVVFDNAQQVIEASPDLNGLMTLDRRGVIVTAAATDHDFVARFFAPKYGVNEDPVTGSAYTQLTPYWAAKTGRTSLRARQLSARGGNVGCRLCDDRVLITGNAVLFARGRITIP